MGESWEHQKEIFFTHIRLDRIWVNLDPIGHDHGVIKRRVGIPNRG